MLRNYFTIVQRRLQRNKLYVGVNVLGLGAAVAMGILAFLNWKFDRDFDRFHRQGERIFRVGMLKEGADEAYGLCPAPLGQAARTGISGVQAFCRWDSRYANLKHGADVWNEEVHFADDTFLEMFDFQMLSGSNDLSDRNKIWLTERLAQRLFGNSNPVGASMLFYAGEPYEKTLTVGGVFKNPPLNSALQFQCLTHFDNLIGRMDKPVDAADWSWFADAVFLLLDTPAQLPTVSKALSAFVEVQRQARKDDYKVQGYWVEPMTEVSRHRNMPGNALREHASREAIYGPVVMAILLLLTAALNFANTTIAISNRRLREIGLRKVLGSAQRQLVGQLLLETGMIVCFGVALGVLVSYWVVPGWNAMWEFMYLQVDIFNNPPLWGFLAGFILLSTLMAGSYPALYISAFRPAHIFRGTLQFGGRNLFSRIFLGVQVMIALISIVAGVSFWQHARFIQAYPTNFDKDNVIAVPLGKGADYPVLKNALAGVPGITAVAGCRTHLVYSGYRKVAEIDGEKREIRMNEVGDDYLQLMDVVLLEGRLFDRDRAADDARSVVVNETFLREMGLQGQPYLGKTIRVDTLAYSIGGVIKDVVNNFFDPLEPQVICRIAPEKSQYLVVKSTREQLPAVDAQLKSTWASLFPYRPYAGFYQSELIAEGLDVTNKIRKIFALFASVTILLTLTSLFALLSLHLQKRRKEVAIRRVLGASEGAIAVLLNRHFALILLLGIALGCAAGAALTQVLISGIFRINNGIEAGVLVFSSLGLLLLALLAAGIMWWQALRSNPAEVLRSE